MSSSTLDDDYDEFDDIEDDEDDEPGFSGLMVLLMGGLMLGAMVAVVWVAYSHGVKMGEDRGDPPIVAADPSPVKVEAAEAGGDSLQREVYGETETPADETVVVAEAPEEPIERPALENPLLEQSSQRVAGAEDAVADRIESLAQEAAAAGDDAEETVAEAAAAVEEGTQAAVDRVAEAAQQAVTRPQPAAATTTATTSPQAAGPLSGSHLVQVAALRSRAEADAAWAALAAELGDYVDGKSPHVLSPTSESDVYYRLRVGPFASKADADAYCAGLKGKGKGCMVRAK
ncbi:MAG: SPOR domain-containing protein [Pseudomonadota bacterium]